MIVAPLAPPAVSAPATRHGRLGVGFGRRFLLLWVTGLAWIVPGFWDHNFLYALAVWDGILFVAWALDLARLPRPSKLAVERRWTAPLYLGVPAAVTLAVRTASRQRLSCTAIDEVPAALRDMPQRVELRRPAYANEVAGTHYLEPSERGDVAAGRVFLRYRSLLDFAERWAVAALQQTVRVYPNLEEARRHTIYLTRSRQIELEKRLLRQRGQGREFESLREHRQGDEFRDICWTATARRGKLVTKVHQVERSQAVWIVLDTGRLLRARSGGFSKLDHAVDAALGLAHLALYSGDRVGLLAYGRRVNHRLAPGRGVAHLRQLVELLAVVRTEVPEADHLRAASAILGAQSRRALVVWLTDLAETAMTPEVIEAGGRMLSRHLLLFMLIGQPEVNAAAAASPSDVDEMYRCVAAQEMVYRRELLLGRLRERGALALEVPPGRLSSAVLNQYLHVKERSLL